MNPVTELARDVLAESIRRVPKALGPIPKKFTKDIADVMAGSDRIALITLNTALDFCDMFGQYDYLDQWLIERNENKILKGN